MTSQSKIRFGVGRRLILSYAGAALFTILAASIAVEALFEIRLGFEKLTGENATVMSVAHELGQNSQSIENALPDLTEAPNQSERSVERSRLEERLVDVEALIGRLETAGADAEILAQVTAKKAAVTDGIRFIAGILTKQDSVNARLIVLRRQVKNTHDTVAKGRQHVELRYRRVVDALGARNDEVVTPQRMATASQIFEQGDQLEAMARIFNISDAVIGQLELALLEGPVRRSADPKTAYRVAMEAIVSEWSEVTFKDEHSKRLIDDLTKGLRRLGDPNDGIFAHRDENARTLSQLNDKIAELRGHTAQLVAATRSLIDVAQANTLKEAGAFEELMKSRAVALTVVVVLCLLVVGMSTILVRRGIVKRLQDLQHTMHEHTLGHVVEIDTSGTDEIAHMARSLDYFVETIKDREREQEIIEERLHDIAKASSDWFWETNADHNLIFLSGRFEEIMGISARGSLTAEMSHGQNALAPARDWLEDITAREPFRDHRHTITDSRGDLHHVKSSGRPMFDGAGEFSGYRGSSTDITAEMQARAQLSAAIEAMPGAFALWDENDRLITFNSLFSQYHAPLAETFHTGIRFEELVRTTAERGLILEAIGRENIFVEERLAQHQNCTGSLVHSFKSGLTVQTNEAKTAGGGTVTIMTDITDGRRTERILQDALDRYQQLADGSLQGIIVHRDLEPLYVNDACARIFGVTPVNGRMPVTSLEPFLAEDQMALFERHASKALEENSEPQFFELQCRRLDGRPIWLMVSVKVINWGGKRALQTLMHDLTARKKIENELRLAKDEAERANRAKTRFLAAASHDLRQPLHAMGLFVSSLAESLEGTERNRGAGGNETNDRLTDRDLKTIRNIEEAQKTVESLLDSLLDISKLDAGILKPEIQVFHYSSLIKRLERTFSNTVARKNLQLRFAPSSVMLKSDPILLERIVFNLVSNAVQYTESGKILVGCRRVGKMVRIECHDTGKGIPEDKFEEIFFEFHRLDKPAQGRRQGFGLGLAIVERVAELLNHPISVNSKIGRGSSFSVEVPVSSERAKIEPLEPIEVDVARLEKPVILAIDDEPTVLEGMKLLVEGWGYRIHTAESADEAVAALANMEKSPTLIIADYRLAANQTGTDAIEKVYQHLDTPVPAVIVTGDTAPERLQEAKESGFLLLHKPLQPAKLRQVIRTAALRRLV